jgi:hypothetical protein
VTQETPRKYTKPTHTKNNLTGDPRLDRKMMQRTTQEKWELLTGDKKRGTGLDGGEQLGRRLSFLVEPYKNMIFT